MSGLPKDLRLEEEKPAPRREAGRGPAPGAGAGAGTGRVDFHAVARKAQRGADAAKRAEMAELRKLGQAFVQALFTGARSRALYAAGHPNAREAFDGLLAAAERLASGRDEVVLRAEADLVIVNDARLRHRELGAQVIEFVASRLRGGPGAVGGVRLTAAGLREQLEGLLDTVFGAAAEIQAKDLDRLSALGIDLLEPIDDGTAGLDFDVDDEDGAEKKDEVPRALQLLDQADRATAKTEDVWARALRGYLRALSILSASYVALRQGKPAGVARVRRAAQGLVDLVETGEYALLSCARIKWTPEPLVNHAVNAAVLALYVGRAIGLERRALADLGVAAMLADAGMCLLPLHVREPLERSPDASLLPADARRIYERHPALSVVALAGVPSSPGSLAWPFAAAYHHHAERGMAGAIRPEADLVSEIVRVCDRYETLSTPARQGERPPPPARALAQLDRSPDLYEPALVAVLRSLLGFFPVGTVVKLSDGGVALVVAPGSPKDPAAPVVRVLREGEQGDTITGGFTRTRSLASGDEGAGPMIEGALDDETQLALADYMAILTGQKELG